MATWEYMVVSVVSDNSGRIGANALKNLNELGQQGWELVTILASKGFPAFFKRQKS